VTYVLRLTEAGKALIEILNIVIRAQFLIDRLGEAGFASDLISQSLFCTSIKVKLYLGVQPCVARRGEVRTVVNA